MSISLTKKISISKKKRPLIIAEISGNHNGDKKSFLAHIKSAKKAGADLVKIQTYEPQDITIKSYKKKFKIKDGIWKNKYLWELYKKAHTPFKWHYDAFKLARKMNIPIFSSPFSERSLNFLSKFNPPIYKVASFEITDLNLIKNIAMKKKPIILSTGMANLKEIYNAIKVITQYHKKIIILYCVSGYPTPEYESNINGIKFLKKKFKDFLIGISDHTNDINSSLASVALGANVIEKHYKISNEIKSLDSSFSIDFNQMRELRSRSEKIFISLGKKIKTIRNSEKKSIILRRSIFASTEIKKGEKLTTKNMITKRPKIGIGAEFFLKLINKKIRKNKKKHDPIYPADF